MFKREKKVCVELSNAELRMLRNSLINSRNRLISGADIPTPSTKFYSS